MPYDVRMQYITKSFTLVQGCRGTIINHPDGYTANLEQQGQAMVEKMAAVYITATLNLQNKKNKKRPGAFINHYVFNHYQTIVYQNQHVVMS